MTAYNNKFTKTALSMDFAEFLKIFSLIKCCDLINGFYLKSSVYQQVSYNLAIKNM